MGVLDRRSGTMQLTAAEHIFVMKPQLVSKNDVVRNSAMWNFDRKASLTEEFGSKKKKRAVRAAQSNIISSENISGATAVESAMSEHFDSVDMNSMMLNAADDALV